LAQRHRNVDLLTITTPADISRHIDRLRAAAAVLVVTENHSLPGFHFPSQVQHTVIEGLVSAGIAPIVLGLRDAYEVQALPNVRTYITALGYAPACARGVGEVVLGERPATGSLPVSLSCKGNQQWMCRSATSSRRRACCDASRSRLMWAWRGR
jgi:hypothetical protein